LRAAVADTHAFLWYATGHSRKLGRNALAHFRRADAGAALVYIPSIAIVELLENVRAGRIRLGVPVGEWLDRLLSSGTFAVADLTLEVAKMTHELQGIPERADRIIAATARAHALPLITRDPGIAGVVGVELLW
jgi:PIN domain nuclease of toxin-antitoxin system